MHGSCHPAPTSALSDFPGNRLELAAGKQPKPGRNGSFCRNPLGTGTIGTMPKPYRLLFWLLAIVLLSPAARGANLPSDGNAAAVLAAQAFVVAATRQYGDAVTVAVHAPAAGVTLPPCFRHEIFVPADSRLWGKTRVGVKCSQPSGWTAYLAVTVSVTGPYLISARKINRGQTMTDGDFETRVGELTELPGSVLSDPQRVLGQRARVSLAARQALRSEHLQQTPVIRQGDRVRVVARGNSFSAAADGVALNNAGIGEPVKVRIANGKTLHGLARQSGEVELPP